MKTSDETRRMLLKGTLVAAAAPWPYAPARADASIRIRQEWQQFKATSHYGSFLTAIAAMRANTNAADPGSLRYWANVHETHCPHGAPYFIAWHRGYLIFFEQQLRIASGDPDLNLPYWDYYAYATLPAEFTDPAPGNPLYLERMGANVHSALDLAPFAPNVFNFQHGTPNAFEPRIEDIHNPIHDLIGGVMSTMQSPLDPIFYLHHASIDRLTHAWALPDGKGIPVSSNPYAPGASNPYWAGEHVYAANMTMARYRTLDPAWLGVDYADTTVPTTLPAAPAERAAPGTRPAPVPRPPLRVFRPTAARRLSATRRSLGGVAQPAFDEQSASIKVRLNPNDAIELARAMALRRRGGDAEAQERVVAIKLVIDRAVVSALAERGGFFYAFYLNMPSRVDSRAAREASFVGTLGAFQIAAASHHGAAKIEFDVSDLLARQTRVDPSALSLSWVRVDGDAPPAGRTIEVAEVRFDLSYEARPVQRAPIPKPDGWYRRRT